ncbi:hypothetical protein, partial [Cellulomonas sp.]|uniref:hypothetical protein n=1 Tax=Cellulomonas sp. TaxID=40001 RepID=UPI0025BD1C89
MSTGQRAAQAGTLHGVLASDLGALAWVACDTGAGSGARRVSGGRGTARCAAVAVGVCEEE